MFDEFTVMAMEQRIKELEGTVNDLDERIVEVLKENEKLESVVELWEQQVKRLTHSLTDENYNEVCMTEVKASRIMNEC